MESKGKHGVREVESSRHIVWYDQWRRIEEVATELRQTHPESFRRVQVRAVRDSGSTAGQVCARAVIGGGHGRPARRNTVVLMVSGALHPVSGSRPGPGSHPQPGPPGHVCGITTRSGLSVATPVPVARRQAQRGS